MTDGRTTYCIDRTSSGSDYLSSPLLFGYKISLKQIEEKLVEESHRRITLKNQPKSLVTLTNQIESLFTQIEKTNLVALQEKKPWTWLSVILLMIYEHR